MLKFVREMGVYLPDEDAVAITALDRSRPITCHIARSALVVLGASPIATVADLINLFLQSRARLEQIIRWKWNRALVSRGKHGPLILVEAQDVALKLPDRTGQSVNEPSALSLMAMAGGRNYQRAPRILVVEDSLLTAEEIQDQLEFHGCEVCGPAPDLVTALEFVSKGGIDGAILDINLGGALCFPVAAALTERGTPFVFLSAYDNLIVPDTYRSARRLHKPSDIAHVGEVVLQSFRMPSNAVH